MGIEDVEAWVLLHITPGYVVAYSPWVETGIDQTSSYCVISPDSGPAPDVEDRRANYTVFLIGPRNKAEESERLMSDANAVIAAIIDGGVIPCGAANIVATGEPKGPGLTTENRAWVQVDFQITF